MKHAIVVVDPGELPHCPTPETREFVAQLVAIGLEVPQIAFCLKITPLEVTRHYSQELVHGTALVNAKVGAALLSNCLRGDTNAQKFWLQTRAGWAPAERQDPKEKDKQGQVLEDRRKFMDEIVGMVARHKAKEEAAAVTQRATPGSARRQ